MNEQSLKAHVKRLTTTQQRNGRDYSVANKTFWYSFYMDYFQKLITNYFEWVNLPPSIDHLFLEKVLCMQGFVGFFKHDELGIIASRGTTGGGLDHYDNALKFTPVTNNSAINFPAIAINWYLDNLDEKKAIIIGNNNYFTASTTWLSGFCTKLADIEQTIQLNRNAQVRPFVIYTDSKLNFSMKNFYSKIENGDPVIKLNLQKNQTGGVDNVQLDDLVHVLNTKSDFLLDKLHDEKQRVINQVLTLIGINNNAVDKAERLVSAEATSNNGLINASIEIQLKARKEAVERINKCWDLEIEVRPSGQIQPYNTEKIDLNGDGEIEKWEENLINE